MSPRKKSHGDRAQERNEQDRETNKQRHRSPSGKINDSPSSELPVRTPPPTMRRDPHTRG